MNWKTTAIAGVIVLIALAACYIFRYNSGYKDGVKDTIAKIDQDSIKVDTLTIAARDSISIASKSKMIHSNRISTEIYKSDSLHIPLITDKGDTIGHMKEVIKFNLKTEVFDVARTMAIKPIEKIVKITNTVFKKVPIEVVKDPPFYNTFLFGASFVSILLVVVGILF